MKTYINHRFLLIEDDNDIVYNKNTDNACGILAVMAIIFILLLVAIIGGLL